MAETTTHFLAEVSEIVNEKMAETGSTVQAFTDYVLEAMADMANLGEVQQCYAIIRNDNNNYITGEINGYSISLSGETVCLFGTVYEPILDESPYSISAEKYNNVINKLQGYYLAAVSGRCNEMEPSAEDYAICKYIYENADDITNIRLFIITNGTIKSTLKKPKQRIEGKLVSFNSWDINKLYSNLCSGSDHLSVDIDLLSDPDYNYRIPFIEMSSEDEHYQTYIAMLPGEFLYRLYENHNTDLLQSNVRFFKGGNNKTNKGIFDTLKTKPHRFLAYNNGLTATAKDVLADYNDDNQTGTLKFIENFQILNGGQTTASIYYAKKANPIIDLTKVFVQMKLILLHDNIEEIHPLITRYSNTQSSVTPSDYSTNNPFNQKLQELSRSIIAPDIEHNGNITHWYYERVSGQYDQDINRLKTKADKEKFKSENPSSQKFDKCELGKVYTAWRQRPDISINGPQKCYGAFIEEFKDKIPDVQFFEDFCAMLMIYRFMEKKNPVFIEYHQVKAQMTLYTLAMLYHVTNGNISLYKIWENQGLSESLKKFINNLSKQLYEKLEADRPKTITFRDFCKSPKTWSTTKNYSFDLDIASISDDMKKTSEETARRKAGKELSEKERRSVESLGAAFWDGLSTINDGTYSEPETKTMSDIAEILNKGKQLSGILIYEGIQILNKFRLTGFETIDIISRSSIQQKRKEKDSASLYKRIQLLSEDDWMKIRLVVGRACDEADAKIVKKVALQKDKSKLTFKQLTVVCRCLDQINEKFKNQIKNAY